MVDKIKKINTKTSTSFMFHVIYSGNEIKKNTYNTFHNYNIIDRVINIDCSHQCKEMSISNSPRNLMRRIQIIAYLSFKCIVPNCAINFMLIYVRSRCMYVYVCVLHVCYKIL